MDLTQDMVAEHLGLSQQQASQWLARLGLDLSAGLDAIRLAYIEQLRAAAAGQGPSVERDGYYRVRRLVAEHKLAVMRGELVPADGVRQEARRTGRVCRDLLLDLAERVGPRLVNIRSAHESTKILEEEMRSAIKTIAAKVDAIAAEDAHGGG